MKKIKTINNKQSIINKWKNNYMNINKKILILILIIKNIKLILIKYKMNLMNYNLNMKNYIMKIKN